MYHENIGISNSITVILCTVVKMSNIPSDFLCNSFADVAKGVEKRVEHGSTPEINPSESSLHESPRVPCTKEEFFSYSCRFSTYVHVTNLSYSEIRHLGQISSAKTGSKKKVWTVISELCASRAVKLQWYLVEERRTGAILWGILFMKSLNILTCFPGGMGSAPMLWA